MATTGNYQRNTGGRFKTLIRREPTQFFPRRQSIERYACYFSNHFDLTVPTLLSLELLQFFVPKRPIDCDVFITVSLKCVIWVLICGLVLVLEYFLAFIL